RAKLGKREIMHLVRNASGNFRAGKKFAHMLGVAHHAPRFRQRDERHDGDVSMPRMQPISLEQAGELRPVLEASRSRMGFLPNSQLILAHRPEIFLAFRHLADAVNGPSATIDRSLKNLIAQMASRAAGCGYCMAHTAHSSERSGISAEKEAALRDYE